jgi:aminomethyltransferase
MEYGAMSDLEIGEQVVAIEDAPEGEDVIQLLPLDAWHRARGGRMVPFAGYEMPVQYEGIMAEHLWTRQSAGLFDVSHMGQLVFTYGDDESGDTDAVAKALEAVLPTLVPALATAPVPQATSRTRSPGPASIRETRNRRQRGS